MDSIGALPPLSTLSPSIFSFLNDNVHTENDFSQATNLVAELQSECEKLEVSLIDLNSRLKSSIIAYTLFSDRIGSQFVDVNARLTDLCSVTGAYGLTPAQGEINGTKKHVLGEELAALAKEVARVETVRAYAETALKLDALVGDIEDVVSATINKHLKHQYSSQNSDKMRLHAVKTLKTAEDILTSITKTRPLWSHLISAVDHRVDRALALLRPHAIADHRSLLAFLGWPPPLSTSTEGPGFFTMQGDLKRQYCESFLALCKLQELQIQRKSRQLEGHNRQLALHQSPWAIEELVNPIAIASQQHFSKWIEKPEFIFALVIKITQDNIDGVDELLQPLVDEAMLVGYSCREEWISSMVESLSTFLAKEMFPVYINQLSEEKEEHSRLQGRVLFLHLIDLMIGFDKRIQTLISQSGISLSIEEGESFEKISSLSVFSDRPDWLELWAEMEFIDTFEKLKLEIDDERNWTLKLSSDAQDYKSPVISSAFVRHLSFVVDRCKILPTIPLRSTFLKLVGLPVLQRIFDALLSRCQEAEGLTALTDDDALTKVVNSINGAHHLCSFLKDWSEETFFLEISFDSGVFDEYIEKLEEFRKEWVQKIAMVILRGFDARSRDYIKNRRQWQENKSDEESWTTSTNFHFLEALDYTQGKLSMLEGKMNGIDFVGCWRNLAAGIDKSIFNGVLSNNVKFSDDGIERFESDTEILFAVFRAWCLRPQAFFLKVSEGLKLLKIRKN